VRFLKVSQSEMIRIRDLYESVMSHACHGLFFREGSVFGEEIVRIAQQDRLKYFETSKNLLKARGWVDEVDFEEEAATVKGGIEVSKSANTTCHRLRGILRNIYEGHHNAKVHCVEVECESTGAPKCSFRIERIS